MRLNYMPFGIKDYYLALQKKWVAYNGGLPVAGRPEIVHGRRTPPFLDDAGMQELELKTMVMGAIYQRVLAVGSMKQQAGKSSPFDGISTENQLAAGAMFVLNFEANNKKVGYYHKEVDNDGHYVAIIPDVNGKKVAVYYTYRFEDIEQQVAKQNQAMQVDVRFTPSLKIGGMSSYEPDVGNDKIYGIAQAKFNTHPGEYWGYKATWLPLWRTGIAIADGDWSTAAFRFLLDVVDVGPVIGGLARLGARFAARRIALAAARRSLVPAGAVQQRIGSTFNNRVVVYSHQAGVAPADPVLAIVNQRLEAAEIILGQEARRLLSIPSSSLTRAERLQLRRLLRDSCSQAAIDFERAAAGQAAAPLNLSQQLVQMDGRQVMGLVAGDAPQAVAANQLNQGLTNILSRPGDRAIVVIDRIGGATGHMINAENINGQIWLFESFSGTAAPLNGQVAGVSAIEAFEPQSTISGFQVILIRP
jgi:hypothetical protein